MKNLSLFFLICTIITSCNKSNDESINELVPKPILGFHIEDTIIYPNSYIALWDTSSNFKKPAYFEWHFEGGTPEFIRYNIPDLPIIITTPVGTTYKNPGEYTVTLTISNEWGVSTLSKKNYIKVVEDTRPRIYGKIKGLEYFPSEVHFNSIFNDNTDYLGLLRLSNEDYELRIPEVFRNKSISIYCYYYEFGSIFGTFEITSDTLSVTINQEASLEFTFN